MPLDQCNDLRAALSESLEFTAEFTAEVEWFRDSDLGLKGMRCRIAAIGDVRPGGEKPPLAALGDGVRATLARRGWKGGDILGRFGESADDYVAYAVRQGRATCHVTIERMFPPRRSEGAGGPPPVDDRPVRLTVSCFAG